MDFELRALNLDLVFMTPERWQQVDDLLQAALERAPHERDAFLAAACGGDAALRQEVASLLEFHGRAAGFIETPPHEVAADLLASEKAAPLVGRVIDAYQVERELGRGGMGEVYLARDTRHNRLVALKLLPAYLTQDAERVRRFGQEAQAALALNHPNIVTIFEIGAADGLHYIVTEYIEGQTLRDLLTGGGLTLPQALDVAVQTASALGAAHKVGILHRDIKPENIMLRPDGYVKVVDFGLAKLAEQTAADDGATTARAPQHTQPGMVMGTVSYMSPEQARGLAVDARTDIWSLGVVLYELVTGHVPFAGETPSDSLALILQTELLPLARYAPDVSTELERIVTKALRKDRAERYQTITDLALDLKSLKQQVEFAAELERAGPQGPRRSGAAPAISSGQASITPEGEHAGRTTAAGAQQPTSSAEYVVRGIKRHRLATLSALLVVVAAAIGLGFYFHTRNAAAAIDSIAVLPFVNQNHDPDLEYRSDGVTESIINSLTQLPALRVIARSSVFRYKGRETDPLVIGQELGARAVLTGRLLQRGDNLTVSVELVDVRANKQLWGEQYERKASDLLAVERELAGAITEKLKVKLSGAEQQQASKHYTESNEAYQSYLKGRFYWNKRTRAGYRQAIEHFQTAIATDPSFALAYAGLADCYNVLSAYGIAPPKEAFPLAKAAATKALALDGNLAEANTSLAYIKYQYDWDWAGAESEFKQAIALNPNYATAHHWYAITLAGMGRMDEAGAEIKRAQELEPLSLVINASAGWIFYHAQRYDEAIAQYRKSLDMEQNFARAHWGIAEPYTLKGEYERAIAELQTARQLDDSPTVLGLLAHTYAAAGDSSAAQKILAELHRQAQEKYVDAYFLAQTYAALGDKEQALRELENAYQARSCWLVWVNVEPKFASLRADPRFTDIVRRVGLAP